MFEDNDSEVEITIYYHVTNHKESDVNGSSDN
jgi:hypothetical protein